MSVCQVSCAVHAPPLRLATLLEQHEQDVLQLASTPTDDVLHARVAGAMGQMRTHCAGMRHLSVLWAHLLISHAELMNCFWRGPAHGEPARTAGACQARHLLAVRALHQQCLGQLPQAERSH